MREAEYIRLTDLTKLRIVRHILCDVMIESLPERDQMTRLLADRIEKLDAASQQREMTAADRLHPNQPAGMS